MYKKNNSKKLMSLILVIALTLAMQVTAFADWQSFQKDATNNGVIIGTAPPISSSVTVDDEELADISGGTYTGVNTTPVMQTTKYNGGTTDTTIAYVLYGADNSADENDDTGGARLAAYDAATGDDLWNIQLAPTMNYSNQLSTPVITAEDTMYAAVTKNIEMKNFANYTGAVIADDVSIDDGEATFTGPGSGAVSTPVGSEIVLGQPLHTIYVTTNLNTASSGQQADYEIFLTDVTNPANVYTLISNTITYSSYGGTYDTYNDVAIPAGTYKITLEVTPKSGATATASTFQMIRYESELYEITDIDTDDPKANIAQTNSIPAGDMRAEGQVNTPLYISGNHLYAGMYGGTRSYYQYNLSSKEVKTFVPNSVQENFYWAGAYSDGTNVYFGGDLGNLYKLSVSTFTHVDDRALGDGKIRSTVVSDGTSLYLTTQGVSAGKLWRINPNNLVNVDSPLTLRENSTSTPVISENEYVYVGWNGYTGPGFTSIGGVQVADINDFASGLDDIYGDGTTAGDPVQASPIVYTNGVWDYVYFTTNSDSGEGYCYRYNGTTPQFRWTAGGTGDPYNRYAPQGFAADAGYLVYGDNGSYIYIIE